MNRRGWVALLAAGALAAAFVVVGTSAVVGRHDRWLAAVGRRLGRPVTAERVGVALMRGIGVDLRGIRIGDDPEFSSAPFLTARALELRLRARALLARRLVVDRIVIEEPTVNLVRDAAGRLNVDSLGGKRAKRRAGAPASTRRSEPVFQVALLRLRHGTVRWSTADARDALAFTDVSVDARSPSFGSRIPIEVHGDVSGTTVRLRRLSSEGVLDLVGAAPAYHGTFASGPGAFGPLAIKRLSGELGWVPPEGTAVVDIPGGRMAALRFGPAVLDVMRPLMRGGDAERLRTRYADLFGDDGLAFTHLSGHARFGAGVLHTDDLVVESQSYRMEGAGSVSSTGDLDFTVRLSASPGLTDDALGHSRARAVLVDDRGLLVIPLQVRGPVAHPRVAPTPEFAANVAAQVLGDKGLAEAAGALVDRVLRPKRRHDR